MTTDRTETEKLAKTANSFIRFVVWCVGIFLLVDFGIVITILILINSHQGH